jgi:microcystin-dependent protein
MEAYLGQIEMFGGSFAPRGWMSCNGALLAIAEYQALFSLLGTTFGGDGQTTFALPDLRGRSPMHWGQGPGLSQRALGGSGGNEQITLTEPQLPSHTHLYTTGAAVETDGYDAGVADRVDPDAFPVLSQPAGGGQAVNNMAPYLAVHFIICVEGMYPNRSD